MRLYPLDQGSSTATHLSRLKNSGYNTGELIVSWSEGIDSFIMIGNGTPDDQVMGILSFRLNGGKIVGIVKPLEATGISVMDLIKTYLTQTKVDKYLILVDQERLTSDELFENVERKMRNIGISSSTKEERDRVRAYVCSTGSKEFKVFIVVNGLDEVSTDEHTIEDHLIKSLGMKVRGTSKETWNSLSSKEKEDAFRRLNRINEDSIGHIFPQQVYGLKLLEET
jgi:hypothetical protein